MIRPTWNEYFMCQAILIATRHSCLKRGVGAVIVKDKSIIGTGYNGAARGILSCLELNYCYYEDCAAEEVAKNKGNPSIIKEKFKIYCQAVHAEANAMSQCNREKAKGSTLYITNAPCPRCAQDIIVTNGIKEVNIWKDYLSNPTLTLDEERATKHILLKAGIILNRTDIKKKRIAEIATYMANSVGERTKYKFKR